MSRQWVPSDYIDEISPPPRNTPGDWVVSLPGDAYALAPADDLDDEAEPRILRDNETVPFYWTEHYGHATLTFRGGGWSVDRKPPPETTHICALGDPDSLAYGKGDGALEEFIKQWRENDPDDGEPISLVYYAWADEPTDFLFHAGAFTPLPANTSSPAA